MLTDSMGFFKGSLSFSCSCYDKGDLALQLSLSVGDLRERTAKMYVPSLYLIGNKQNQLGYVKVLTSASPTTTQSCYLVYQLFLIRKNMMDISLSLSPYKKQSY